MVDLHGSRMALLSQCLDVVGAVPRLRFVPPLPKSGGYVSPPSADFANGVGVLVTFSPKRTALSQLRGTRINEPD